MPPLPQRGPAGRADLLWWLARSGETADQWHRVAALVNLEAKPAPPKKLPPDDARPKVVAAPRQIAPLPVPDPVPPTTPLWCAVVERHGSPATAGEADQGPHCLRGVAPLTAADLEPAAPGPLLRSHPLLPWARLWPFLKAALGAATPGAIDVPRLVDGLARGKPLVRLPRLSRRRWAPQAQVLLDFGLPLGPFRTDFNRLCMGLSNLRGALGLELLRLEDHLGGRVRPWIHPKQWGKEPLPPDRPWQPPPYRPWRPPPADAPLLVCSDLGLHAPADSAVRRRWLDFGRRLAAGGRRPLVLAPVSPERLTRDHLALFDIVCYGPETPLRPCRAPGPPREAAALGDLQALLSPAIRIEPELLRAAVALLAPAAPRAGLEAALWNHAEVVSGYIAAAFHPEAARRHRTRFAALPAATQERLLALLQRAHAHCFPAVGHEETLAWAGAAAPEVAAVGADPVRAAARFFLATAAEFYGEAAGLKPFKGDWAWRHLGRSQSVAGTDARYLSVLYAVAHREVLLAGDTVPEGAAGLDPQEILRALGGPGARPRPWLLAQRGEALWLLPDPPPPAEGPWQPPFSPLVRLQLAVPLVTVNGPDAAADPRNLPLAGAPVLLGLPPGEGQTLHLLTGDDALSIAAGPRPAWARRLWRDAAGLHAAVIWLGREQRLDWALEGGRGAWRAAAGAPVGVDDVGLYADFAVGEVVQRCRWIVPGTFLMGSPPEEAERDGDETQHAVTLSRGYWLADTACTQGLWRAVMGANPSGFQGDPARPVETVSWNGVQDFLRRLNALIPGLAAGLPTEAQWEYACRAGTTGPFSFGGQISPEQVNYNGNYPYAGGKTGQYRQETVPVSSLPANPWGLYQMHGNVWEWCADWYGAYGAGPQVDPVGPAEGAGRVLRGGSWNAPGGFCRSASRSRYAPDVRVDFLGFRLAPGQGGGGGGGAGRGRAEPAAGQAPATPSRVRKTSPSRPKARKGRT